MRYLIKFLFSLIVITTGFTSYSQETFQKKIEEAYTSYMCECLDKYKDTNVNELNEIFGTTCLSGFNEDRWLPMLQEAAVAREVEVPGTKEEFQQFERDILSNVRTNTIISLLDNCPTYKKSIIALRESTANEFNEEFDIQRKYNAKPFRESLTYQTKREKSISLMSLGTIYEQRKDYSRAMSFYRESYDVMPRYKIKGFIHLLSSKPGAMDPPAPSITSAKKETNEPKKDVKELKGEVEDAFVKHHCDCLNRYMDKPVEELMEAYRNTCYEEFIPREYRAMTKNSIDIENPERSTKDIQKDLIIEVLSSTAARLVDECEAYRKVLNHSKVLLKDQVEKVQSTVSHDPLVLMKQISSYNKGIQANVLKLLGLYEEGEGNLEKAMEFYKVAYKIDAKSQLLAYVRLLERQLEGKE